MENLNWKNILEQIKDFNKAGYDFAEKLKNQRAALIDYNNKVLKVYNNLLQLMNINNHSKI